MIIPAWLSYRCLTPLQGQDRKATRAWKLCHSLCCQEQHQDPSWKLELVYFSNKKVYHFQSPATPFSHSWHLTFSRAHHGDGLQTQQSLHSIPSASSGDIPCKTAGLQREHQECKTPPVTSQKPQVSLPDLQFNSLSFTSHPPHLSPGIIFFP